MLFSFHFRYRPINQNNAPTSQPSTKKRSEAVASSSSTSSSKASLRSVHKVIEKERSAGKTISFSCAKLDHRFKTVGIAYDWLFLSVIF